jgi:hypothetical protein
MNHLGKVFDGEFDVVAAEERDQVERPRTIGQCNQHLKTNRNDSGLCIFAALKKMVGFLLKTRKCF